METQLNFKELFRTPKTKQNDLLEALFLYENKLGFSKIKSIYFDN